MCLVQICMSWISRKVIFEFNFFIPKPEVLMLLLSDYSFEPQWVCFPNSASSFATSLQSRCTLWSTQVNAQRLPAWLDKSSVIQHCAVSRHSGRNQTPPEIAAFCSGLWMQPLTREDSCQFEALTVPLKNWQDTRWTAGETAWSRQWEVSLGHFHKQIRVRNTALDIYVTLYLYDALKCIQLIIITPSRCQSGFFPQSDRFLGFFQLDFWNIFLLTLLLARWSSNKTKLQGSIKIKGKKVSLNTSMFLVNRTTPIYWFLFKNVFKNPFTLAEFFILPTLNKFWMNFFGKAELWAASRKKSSSLHLCLLGFFFFI